MRDTLLRPWLGQQVAVIVDRPLGTTHPRHPDLAYPVNYGYIPGTHAPDGHPVDVYILGIEVPVTSFLGEVIAIVVREDDIEDKLVAVPAGMRLRPETIRDAIAFQEQYFTTRIVMNDT